MEEVNEELAENASELADLRRRLAEFEGQRAAWTEQSERIKACEQRCQRIAEQVTDVIWMGEFRPPLQVGGQTATRSPADWESLFRLSYLSPSVERVLGYPAEEVPLISMRRILTDDSYRRLSEIFADEITAGDLQSRVVELEHVTRLGDHRHCETTISLTVDSQNRVTGALGVSRDVTERVAVQRALTRLVETYERERRQAAYEIHDSVAQPLVAAAMSLEALLDCVSEGECRQRLEWVLGLLRNGVDSARRLMTALRPPILDEMGIVSAIDHLVSERSSAAADVEFEHNLGDRRFAAAIETAAFRIAQECLDNALRHSHSPRVRLAVIEEEGRLSIEARDWGVGFDTRHIDPGRFGLEEIRQRARLLKGTAAIISALGQGTHIIVKLPATPACPRVAEPSP